jgi:hypothetical protein
MATEPRQGLYLTRKSYREATLHQFDELLHIGYDWRSNSLKKSLSGYLLNDSKRVAIVEQMQILIAYIMDYASNIKKSINYTVDKNYKYLN